MSHITERFFLGNAKDAMNEEFIIKNNIGLIINFAIEVPKPEWPILKKIGREPDYIKYNLYDNSNQVILPVIYELYEIIENYLYSTNKNILFHCYAGISRSSTALIGILMLMTRNNLQDIYDEVKKRRPIVNPNRGFINQLVKLDYILNHLKD